MKELILEELTLIRKVCKDLSEKMICELRYKAQEGKEKPSCHEPHTHTLW